MTARVARARVHAGGRVAVRACGGGGVCVRVCMCVCGVRVCVLC
jgi:hypothetical protein